MTTLKQLAGGNLRQYGIVGALAVIVLLFQVMTDGRLLLPNNVASLIQQNAYVMILAAGMVIVIIAGHIDLSVGSIVGFIGGTIALLMKEAGLPWWLAILA
ncbi:MAG TPA: sugar ABC transporter permease, partial [Actinotalea sp.]|nr:sugar ABC transporter permease [Actinotalea sp.]